MLQTRPAYGWRQVFLTDDNLVLYDPELAGLFGKIKKAVKKVVKSKVFKYAVIAGAAGAAIYFGGPAGLKAVQNIAGKLKQAKAARAAAKTQEQADRAAAAEAQAQAEYDAAVRAQAAADAAAARGGVTLPADYRYVPGAPPPPGSQGAVEYVRVEAEDPGAPAVQRAGMVSFAGLPWPVLALGAGVVVVAVMSAGGRRR
jgi:hypothetical protein